MGMSRRRHLDSPSIEYFLVKDDDGCMPGSDASTNLTTIRPQEQGHHMPSICLPISCVDMALTMPLLRSYTYSFTGEDISVVGWR
jgi:hypothetical protein